MSIVIESNSEVWRACYFILHYMLKNDNEKIRNSSKVTTITSVQSRIIGLIQRELSTAWGRDMKFSKVGQNAWESFIPSKVPLDFASLIDSMGDDVEDILVSNGPIVLCTSGQGMRLYINLTAAIQHVFADTSQRAIRMPSPIEMYNGLSAVKNILSNLDETLNSAYENTDLYKMISQNREKDPIGKFKKMLQEKRGY